MADENNNPDDVEAQKFVVSEINNENENLNTNDATKIKQPQEKEVVIDEMDGDAKEMTIDENAQETTVNEQEKETSFNENTKETTITEGEGKTPPKNEEEETNENNDAPEIDNKKDDKEEDGDEEKGPFKEGDIIQYMYTDWLIGGMNWLWAYSAKELKTSWFSGKREKNREKAEKNKHKDLERHDAYKIKNKYGNKALEDAEKKSNEFKKYNGLVELCDKIRDGKIDETNLPEKTKLLIKTMPQKDFKEFFAPKRIKNAQENIKSNIIAATQFANLYATTAMLESKMQDKNFSFPEGNDKAFERLKKEGLTNFAKAMNREATNGGNPNKLSGKLLSQVQKAYETSEENLENGRFSGYNEDKKPAIKRGYNKLMQKKYGQPKPNQAWNNLNALVQGVNPKEPPVNMFEAMIMEQSYDAAMKQHFSGLDNEDMQKRVLEENLKKRRIQLEKARAKIMNDPEAKIARLQKEGERAKKRIDLIKRLSNPDYVITYTKGPDKGKQDPEFTRRMRERFGINAGK